MKESDILKVVSILPNFIKLAENDLGENEHTDIKEMTVADFDLICDFQVKLTTLLNYVDIRLFK